MARTASAWKLHYTPIIANKFWVQYYPRGSFHVQTSDVQSKFLQNMHLKYTLHKYGVKGGLQKGHRRKHWEHVSRHDYAFLHRGVEWNTSKQVWEWWDGKAWVDLPVDRVFDRKTRTWS